MNHKLNKEYSEIAIYEGLLPIKVTPFYKTKIEAESSVLGELGPLWRVAFPSEDRISLRSPNEVEDFVGDRSNTLGQTGTIMKYANRVLFMATSRCFGHCQYCFRTSMLAGSAAAGGSEMETESLNHLLEFLRANASVTEVILSGGDPLTIPGPRLGSIVEGISSVSTVRSIRIHTRAIVYEPRAFTTEKMDLLAKHNVRVVFHIAHPYELCEVVAGKISELREKNIRLYNQFPLLRNINDHPLVLYRLLEILDEVGVRNLSIFIPDPIFFSAAFRVRLSRVWQIADQLSLISPSWINSTRFVFDSSRGKVRREYYIGRDPETDIAIFMRGNDQIRFPDFPEHLDLPGSLANMLWKEER